ncbi:IucA/IucC family protein [Legionella sp. CNM-4043-24]|uniref:IucA/IucC family protein n=1 Tax=Legionella sp. CNM-4043-24 TaxID=3421646 RepID=UPI00403A8836
MALAYSGFDEMSHQLRFMLFEIGLGLSQASVERYINQAHRSSLQRLQQAALDENLIDRPIASHHVHDYIDQLQQRLKLASKHIFSRWERLQDELNESIANEAMALAWRERWQSDLAGQARGAFRFWDWLLHHHSTAELLLFLEQWGSAGHPTHPNFRAKMGFNRREVLQYSPEFQARVSVHWCALRKSCAQATGAYSEVMSSHFPEHHAKWKNTLLFQHLNPDEYIPVPIHPWQWRNQLQKNLSDLIGQKDAVLAPHHQTLRPSMSFRTMIPEDSLACHIKLATAIHTTSATRTVSPASVHNGPSLSQWVQSLLKENNHFDGRFFLAADLAGAHLADSSSPLARQKQMAVILRENPLRFLGPRQSLVPLAALFVAPPLSGKPLLFDIINASQHDPVWYFSRYCHIVINAQLELMLQYGLAFEAHQQNTLVVFEDHLPHALVIRDLGGICLSQHAAWQNRNRPVLHPDSTIGSDRLMDLGNTFVHGNLASNIEYWITAMSLYYPLPARDLWLIVYQSLDHAFQRLKSRVDPLAWARLREQILAQPWQRKCLLSMRLSAHGKMDERMARVNPLSVFHD